MRCEIIAEIGINHNGDMDLAGEMIFELSEMGVDIAKFQLYDPNKLLNSEDFSKSDWEAICNSELTFDQTKRLFEYCEKWKIEFLASAFDEERLGWLEELGVKRHKIASRTIRDEEYVAKVFDTGKLVFVSTGYFEDILEIASWRERVYYFCKDPSIAQMRFLYCISKYPTSLDDLDFRFDMFSGGIYSGFSDHTQGIIAAQVAMVLGARFIEKHVTIDKSLPGPDQTSSLTLNEMQRLCDFRDNLIKIKICD